MRLTILILALVLISGVIVFQFDEASPGTSEISASVGSLVEGAGDSGTGFKQATAPIAFEFPQDHGPHPDYRAEWWYYTGNLADAAGNRYGYQFTIFRRGLEPGAPNRISEWATRQIYFAHFTVTDVAANSFTYHERFSRAAPDLAGAQGEPRFEVWLDDWSAREIEPGKVRLQARAEDIALDLVLEQAKPAALQGLAGLSAKSNEPGNASYYYSLTNNLTSGSVTTPRGTFAVTGNSWMDREWSTSDLDEGAVGWDWFSLQLDDGREVTFYYIRRQDGSAEPVSAGIVINADGTTARLELADVQIETLAEWTSPTSGAVYPAQWRFTAPAHNIDVVVTPLISNQELNVSFTYWEGAVRVDGSQGGYGYVELTGYKESLRGRM